MAPAIALAYEKAEADIMNRPPRDSKTDRLVSTNLLTYSYIYAGFTNIGFCLLNFFLVFIKAGINPADLYNAASILILIIYSYYYSVAKITSII